jgi:hypothetical protein
MSMPENEFDGAQIVLRKYYRELVRRMAEDILEHREDFEAPGFAGQAEDILEKYSQQLCRFGTVYSNMKGFVSREKPKGKEPLGKDEFRCFGCGSVIGPKDESCQKCGWSWK